MRKDVSGTNRGTEALVSGSSMRPRFGAVGIRLRYRQSLQIRAKTRRSDAIRANLIEERLGGKRAAVTVRALERDGEHGRMRKGAAPPPQT